MWQPSRKQWALIWPVAIFLVLAWPPDTGRSLGMKLVNWAVDPRGELPSQPPPLPMGLDDDGDAVSEHDMLENAYLQYRGRSAWIHWRMDMKDASDPLESSTQRQLLVGVLVAAALTVWGMDAARAS